METDKKQTDFNTDINDADAQRGAPVMPTENDLYEQPSAPCKKNCADTVCGTDDSSAEALHSANGNLRNVSDADDNVAHKTENCPDAPNTSTATETPTDERDFLPQADGGAADNGGAGGSASVAKRQKLSKLVNVAIIVLIVLFVAILFIRSFIFTRIVVDGMSMQPTYNGGETVNVSKVTAPKRGDIVIFYENDIDSKFLALFATSSQSQSGGKYAKFIKRVVALAGDKIWAAPTQNEDEYYLVIQTAQGDILYEDYYVFDDETLPQDRFYIHDRKLGNLGNLRGTSAENPYIVAENCFFALGDNRDNSHDSRVIGDIPLTRLFGVVV